VKFGDTTTEFGDTTTEFGDTTMGVGLGVGVGAQSGAPVARVRGHQLRSSASTDWVVANVFGIGPTISPSWSCNERR
jgi:hypothetical protein